MDFQREAYYKLAHYKIIEVVGVGLWWETHDGLSNRQTGRCFIEGNILVIGPVESQWPGFLKREFIIYNYFETNIKTQKNCCTHKN